MTTQGRTIAILTEVRVHLADAVKLEQQGQITDALAVMRHASMIANDKDGPNSWADVTCPACDEEG